MGTIYLVRHGQASFGTNDYDRLTQTGFAQARLLGAYFRFRNIRFDAVHTGTLRRHVETAHGIFEGHPEGGGGSEPERVAGLDEYNPVAVIMALTGRVATPDAMAERRDPAVLRDHFRLLRDALIAWAEGRSDPAGMPSWRTFQDGAVAAVVEARQRCADGNVLIVSSGGPIAAIVADNLQAPPRAAIDLNLRMRNSSVTELSSNPRRHSLVSFNSLPHLDTNPDRALITYA